MSFARMVELVDTRDLKSLALLSVWVRVPLRATWHTRTCVIIDTGPFLHQEILSNPCPTFVSCISIARSRNMSAPRAFISFDFDHDGLDKMLFVGQARNSKSPFSIQDWSSKFELPQDRWEDIIEKKIRRCDFVIVLVGLHMKTAYGVVKEIEMAKRSHIPMFGVYVNGANSSVFLPKGLSRADVINWKWDSVADAIEDVQAKSTERSVWSAKSLINRYR